MSRMSRRIVVDASVARAAGTTANPISSRSREFLQAMLRICHRVVMTPEVHREWQRHQSNFSTAWLAAMRSRRKLVAASANSSQRESLVAAILDSDLGTSQRAAAEKDCLLVTAAWATDGVVASNDNKVRSLLRRLTDSAPELARVVWVDPTDPDETPVAWLEAGARNEARRRLGTSARRK